MKVLPPQPAAEVEVAGPIRVHRPARPPRAEPRVGPRDPRRHAGARATPLLDDDDDGRDPPGHLGRCAREVPRVPRAGGHRRAPPQRQLLRRALPAAVPRPGGQGDRRASTMLAPGERVLVAVSGGKDSPRRVGHPARARLRGRRPLPRARHRRLQRRVAPATPRAFAAERGLTLHRGRPARTTTATTSRPAAKATRRVPCSACGLSKRHLFDQAALDGGYDVVATGHNLDDEAAVLFGNVLRWQTEYLGRQLPVLPGPRRLPPQGEAAGAPRRAGDGRLLRAAGHRLHRRGVPDGRGQQAPRLQGGAQRHRGARRRAPSTTSTSASSSGRADRFAAGDGARPTGRRCGRARAAARRRRARCAPSAGWSSGPARRRAGGAAGRAGGRRMGARLVRSRGRAGAAHRRQAAALPRHPRPRAASSTPTPGSSPTTTSSAQPRASRVRVHPRRAATRPSGRRSRTSC